MHLVTYNGIEFNYNAPTKEMINIKDIIYSLSRINRFVGHSSRAYSVAEHSYLCYLVAKRLKYSYREQLLVLIHDFTEAYVGDCPAPLKRMLPEFSKIEERVENTIYEYINIPKPTEYEHGLIKQVDLTLLAIEMRDLTNHNYTNYLESVYIDIVEDDEFSVSKNTVSESTNINNLFNAYNELLNFKANTGYDKYKIIYFLKNKKDDYNCVFEYHSDITHARRSGRLYAEGLYHLEVEEDVLDIMKSEGVDEETAYILFSMKMNNEIYFHVSQA